MPVDSILLEVKNLKKYFPVRKGILRRVVAHVKAVDDIDMYIKEGETLNLGGGRHTGSNRPVGRETMAAPHALWAAEMREEG